MSNWNQRKIKRKISAIRNSPVEILCLRLPTRRFSSLQGFLSENEIRSYQNDVVEANIEQWQKYLPEGFLRFFLFQTTCRLDLETFPTKYFPIEYSDVKFFLRIFDKYFRELHNKQQFDEIRRRKTDFAQFDDEEKRWIDDFEQRFQPFIDEHFPNSVGFFVKTSSRSAKDAVIFNEDFLQIYQNELKQFSNAKDENARIFALLTAAFLSLKVSSAREVLSMFFVSERIYQDFLLVTEVQQRKSLTENLILRQFYRIDVDLELDRKSVV